MISELDLKIIHALQIAPRVTWDRLADVLAVSGPTLARHWEEMVIAGTAWVTPFPGPRYLETGWSAFVYLSSTPSTQEEIVKQLCADPAFATVSLISGSHDLMVDCYAASYDALLRRLTESFAPLVGLTHREVIFSTEIYRSAAEWRSKSLEPSQVRRLAARPGAAGTRYSPDAVDIRLVEMLAVDGRASWVQLADACGVAPQTARRRIERVLASGQLSLRCDAAMELAAGQKEVTLLISIPATDVKAIGSYLASLPGCRLSAEILGTANMLVTMWVHDFVEVRELEVELGRRAPLLAVTSRHVTVRHYKRAGRLLDAQGKCSGRVPVPLWGELSE